jgi:putative transposase
VRQVQAAHGVSERRSCVALGVDRSTIGYRSTKPDQAPLRLRIRDLAKTRVRYGYSGSTEVDPDRGTAGAVS